jgi:hypothetical protein
VKKLPHLALLAGGVALIWSACRQDSSTSDRPVASSPSAGAASAQPSTAPPPSAATRSTAPPSESAGSVTGKVLETMNSGGYTYMRLAAAGGETWAAVNPAKVKKGQTVKVENAIRMDGFQSGTLHRTFDHIVFGTLAGGASPVALAASGATGTSGSALAAGHPDASDPRVREMLAAQHAAAATEPVGIGDVKVSKASGSEGHTIAETFAERASLKNKEIAVRGKVVKFLPGIMGRNWLHLRDGSGSPARKDNDLTATTSETAAVGEVVTVKGTVRIDRDFGAGYAYPVIIEDGRISK